MGTRPHRSIMEKEKQLGRGIALTTRPFTLSLLFFRFCWEESESQGPLLLPADRIDPSSRSPLLSVEYNTSASPYPTQRKRWHPYPPWLNAARPLMVTPPWFRVVSTPSLALWPPSPWRPAAVQKENRISSGKKRPRLYSQAR